MRDIDHIVSKVIQLEHDKGNIKHSTDRAQLLSVEDTVSDLIGNIYDFDRASYLDQLIGKVMINLINICERNRTSVETCLNKAYKSANEE
jgi:hypothetical protein